MERPSDDHLSELTELIVAFRDARDWEQFHTPKNLASAISIEAAELQEHFLWADDEGEETLSGGDEEIEEEVADILIFTLLFAHRAGIDPARAIRDKVETNRERYPADEARGRSDKYTAYEED